MTKKGRFKSMGAEILDSKQRPATMGDFLELNKKADATVVRNSQANVSMPNSAIAQNRISPPTHPSALQPEINKPGLSNKSTGSERVTRLHVHIRKDLADALFQEVFRRKTDGSVPNKNSTQRVIIEQALEAYFNKTKK
jgi:hypothetical protein